MRSRVKKQKLKNKKWIFRGILTFIILVIGVGVYAFFQLDNTLDKMYQPVDRLPSSVEENNQPADTKTFLLVGIDKDSKTKDDVGRSDVLMVVIVNDKTKKISLTSIPRDTYVEIAGKNYKDKINASYQYGLATTIATVENFTDIHIDNYIVVNYDGVTRSIDAIGGLLLNVDNNAAEGLNRDLRGQIDFPHEGGQYKLSGSQSLYFARFRNDKNGDFGRNERQQQVIKAFLDQSTDVRSPVKINKVLDAVGDGVATDLTKTDIFAFAKQLTNYSSNNIESIHYRAYPDRFGPQNLWYVVIPNQEQERVSSLLKERLNADEGTILTNLTDVQKGFTEEEIRDIKDQESVRRKTKTKS